MHFSVSSLLTLAVAATAVVAQPAKRALSLNPTKDYLHEVKWKELAPVSIHPATNAKRFAQGLPPLVPKRRNRGTHGGALHANKGTRVASAPRAETSPVPPATAKCNILVKDISSGASLGYVSAQWNDFAEYGPLQASQLDALEVSFTYSADSAKQLDLVATNGKSAAHPFFGASVGFASTNEDIREDNYNYLLLTGNTQTPAGATPSYAASNSFSEASSVPVASESAIWSYDPASQALTAWWVNNDGSSVSPHILWSNQNDQTFFTLTGNPGLFKGIFGVDAPEVTFTCVPPVTVA
ncbi:hypothetical protein FRC11_013768 [Ceratobasidium sp. 423]|nr:hypothetical protein FRC11_013768 [Ceratobasidium sp. 423]